MAPLELAFSFSFSPRRMEALFPKGTTALIKDRTRRVFFLFSSASHLSRTPPRMSTPHLLLLRQTNRHLGAPFIFLASLLRLSISCLIERFHPLEVLTLRVCVFHRSHTLGVFGGVSKSWPHYSPV